MAKRVEDFVVSENSDLKNGLYILTLTGNSYFPELKPGQFIQVKIDGSPETFLRRPLSIHDVDYEKNAIRVLFQVAGKGTMTLSGIKAGEKLNVIYPLGNSFTIPAPDENVLLIGGGCGVAPLMFLGKHLKSLGFNPEVLLGFRNSNRIVELDEYQKIGKVHLTTEDGSQGEKGFVTDHSVLKGTNFDRIYCCGPDAMMRAVGKYCLRYNINCEVSLEHLMACGFGVCLCCVVNTDHGNLTTCQDGPVFNIKDLRW